MDTILSVTTADVGRLRPGDAVAFFSQLLWGEATRIGLPVTRVNISSRTNVADGGVDATVTGDGSLPSSDLLVGPPLAFQIKTGDFKPWQPAVIRKELFGKAEEPTKDALASQVRTCMDANGTYVLVCTGVDLTSEERDAAIQETKVLLDKCGYSDPKVDVHSQNQLIAVLRRFPSLSMRLNGREHPFQTLGSWAFDAEMRLPFHTGKPQESFVGTLREELRRTDEAVHVHVQGEAGVGKTRLVLEATRALDLAPLVVYCEQPSKALDSALLNDIRREDNQFAVILVVDKCEPTTRSQLWNALRHRGARVKLITIFNEPCEVTGSTRILDAPPLGQEQAESILLEYGVPQDQARRWLALCGGSARAVHAVGANLQNNPEDILRSPDTVSIWDRYVAGRDPLESLEVQQRRTTLRYLALFRRFGYGPDLAAESRAVARMIETADPGITWPRFHAIVKELRQRRLLHGENTLYITPRLLHIRLWKEWWDTYGAGVDLQQLTADLPGPLLAWLNEMFVYGAESPAALSAAKHLLGAHGPFQTSPYLETDSGSRLFLALTEAAPEAALNCLSIVVGTRSLEELARLQEGRRQAIWALERIVVWKDCFLEGARLLLQLAEAENEGWSNNATGVFASLFSPGYGQLSRTEASAEARFPILEEALLSESQARRRVALKACRSALEANNFSRVIGAEHQGIRPEPQLWIPKTWGEIFDAYRRVWRLVFNRLDAMTMDDRKEACEVLLHSAPGLAYNDNLVDEILDTLRELSTRPWMDRRRLIEVVEHVLRYVKPKDGTRRKWEALRDNLTGDDFRSRVGRYVGMSLLEDNFDDRGNVVDKLTPIMNALANEALQKPDALLAQLDWLVTDKAPNAYAFGHALGTRDPETTLLSTLVQAQRAAEPGGNPFLLGGYLRAMFERDRDGWERQLDALSEDDLLQTLVPDLTWRSGLTDRAAMRILRMAQGGHVAVSAFRMFGYGGVISGLSEAVLAEWIRFLLAANTRHGATIALTLFYYFHKDSTDRPKAVSLLVLTASPLFVPDEGRQGDQMEAFYWTEIVQRLLKTSPGDALGLTENVLDHFGEDGTVVDGSYRRTHEVLEELVRNHPNEMWERIMPRLGPPLDDRAFHLTMWLRGGTITLLPEQAVWKWVEADIDNRAWYIASFVPPFLGHSEQTCFAREVLVRYGDHEDVRRNLHANMSTGSWSGPPSEHYRRKADQLRAFRETETNLRVLQWVDESLRSLDERVRRERIAEEREAF